MNSRLVFAVISLVGLFSVECVFSADAPARPVKVLFLTQSKGYLHSSVNRSPERNSRRRRRLIQPSASPDKQALSPAEVAMTQLGQQTGLFQVHCTQDAAADFTRENLKNYDLVMFYTTGDLPIKHEDLEYFLNDWLKQKGHGFVGFHSASDTYKETEPYWDMIGGTIVNHPWTSTKTVTITVLDPTHPAARPFGKEFQIKDEIYRYRHWQPEKVHVLLALNMEKCIPLLSAKQLHEFMTHADPKEPYEVPVSWVKDWGHGKIFYTNLGHNETTWTDKRFLASVEGGIRWLLGMEQGDATPNPELSKAENQKAKAAADKQASR
jgi:type 1 glutamine amidotransferase